MIENLRITLQTIIQSRTAFIQAYSNRNEGMGTQTDMKAQAVNRQKIISTLEIPMVLESIDTIGQFLNSWVNESDNLSTQRSRRSFVQWIMRYADPQKKYQKKERINFIIKQITEYENKEYIICNLHGLIYRAYKAIENEKSKKQYSSYLFNMEGRLDDFLLGMEKLLWRPFHRDHPQFTGEVLTYFLDFLEQTALKSTSPRPYLALLICRALMYAPLPAKKLFSLGCPNEQQLILESEGKKFHVTDQFIKFWKCFNEPHLFPTSLRNCKDPEKYLNIVIKRLSKRAKLPICLTPTMLRLVREACCPGEGCFR